MPNTLPRASRIAVLLTYLGLWAEALVLAFWPLMALGVLAFGVVRLADPSLWGVEALWAALAGLAVAVLWAMWRGVRMFAWPQRAVAQARVDAHLPGNPIQALTDTQATATDDPAAAAVWAAHQQQMQARAAKARAVDPDLRVSKYDPYAMRYVALLIAVLGVFFGQAFAPRDVALLPGAELASGPSWEGWVQPPAYTRKPTIYLNDVVGQDVVVPEGSAVTLRLYGDVGDLTVAETVSARLTLDGSVADAVQRFTVAQSGSLSISGDGGAEWAIVMVKDKPPQVQLSARMEVDNDTLHQRFLARDDYGVTAGRATMTLMLDEVNRIHGLAADPMPRAAYQLALPLTISGDRSQFEETLSEDFSKNPWVGLPVQIVLEVEDIKGQTGQSATLDATLPGRRFFDPMAKALIEQRRDILWTPKNNIRVAQILRAISLDPDDVFRDPADADSLHGIIDGLEGQVTPDVAERLAEDLWTLALAIEEGDLADARDALERAQEKLAEAIRNGASPDEIQRLMDELRDAQRDYMREFAERNPPEPGQQRQQGEQGEEVTQDQLEEMMERLQQLMEEGRMAEAQELLEEINRLMENLQVQEGQPGEGGQGEGQQSMEDLGETLRQQQELSDDAFRELQEGQQGGQQQGETQPGGDQGQQQGDEPGGQQGQQQDGTGEGGEGQGANGDQPGSLADRQEALRRQLEAQRRGLPAPGTEEGDAARRSLDQAEGAMDRAEQDLRDGDIPSALDNQAQAMEALREGLRSLGRALAEEQQNRQGEGQPQRQADGSQGGAGQPDPLGRNNGGNVNPGGPNEDMLGENDLRQRSQDLLDEIERRGQDLARPERERDYLERLLDPF